jgi:hypothetical protein
MGDYITHRYAVATKQKGRVWTLFIACDDFSQADAEFSRFSAETHPHIEQVGVFTRGQWNGRRDSMRLRKNLQERTDPIPASIGMWLVNQADSGYF